MCGIVGFITAEKGTGSYARRRWFTNALLTNVVRGDDGTGVIIVPSDHDSTADWAKLGGDASHFLATKEADDRLNSQAPWNKYRAVIGHNRSATVGGVSTKNAHPFQEGPITLVHNGTLHTTYGLPKGRTDLKEVDVDSHVITHNLATHDAEEVIGKLDGAFVLVWHDARDQSINIVRNSQRPLHFMPVKCEKTILIASEAEMLTWLVRRNNDFREGPVFFPQEGQWMKFVPDQGLTPIVKKVELNKAYDYSGWGGGYGRSGGRRAWSNNYHAWDDDYDGPNYARSGGYQRPKAGPVQPKEPDAPKPPMLPKVLGQTLDEAALMHGDKIRFAPTSVVPVYGTKYANVIGRCVDLNRMGVVQGLVLECVDDCIAKQEMWTVNPIAMKATDAGSVLLLKLSKRSVTHTTEPVPSWTSSQGGATGSTDGGVYEYFGPGNVLLTKEQWRELVACGCSMCGQVIDDETAEEVEWDLDDNKPICPECVLEMIDDAPGHNDYDDEENLPWCAGE